ncbi:MAG: hypothetical protein Q8R44_11820 [Novosphingobium sp.]|nr:hypothetical protein [Novosphingobium sp.]
MFGVTDGAGLVNVFAGQADVSRPDLFRTGKAALPVDANLTSILRRVVFIGEAALRQTLNFERVGLRVVNGGDHLVVRALGLGNPAAARTAPAAKNFTLDRMLDSGGTDGVETG